MIRIVCVGKLKERYLAEASDEYLKRLGKYAKVEVIEIKERADKNPEVEKANEASEILEKISGRQECFNVALDLQGKQLHSEEFSQLLKKQNILFIIGGPEGLAKSILEQADAKISLSKMTFTHQIARILLLEQIYRGYTILKNEKYHR